MKKISIFIVCDFLFLFNFSFLTKAAEQSNNINNVCLKYAGQKAIYRENEELKSGQIGKIKASEETTIYRLEGDTKVDLKTVNPGTTYRVYSSTNNKFDIGGGYFIDKDSKIIYKTPNRELLVAVQCINQKTDLITNFNIKESNGKGIITNSNNSIVWYNPWKSEFIIYDTRTKIHTIIHDNTNRAIYDYFVLNNYLYFTGGMPGSKNFNNEKLYRIKISNPSKLETLAQNILSISYYKDSLYYSVYTYGKVKEYGHETGVNVFKMDANGKNIKLIKNINQKIYGHLSPIINGQAYFEKWIDKSNVQIFELNINNGKLKTLNKLNTSNRRVGGRSGTGFTFYDERDVIMFEFLSSKLWHYEGAWFTKPKMYGNKLYYIAGVLDDELYVTENNGKAQRVLKSPYGRIIEFSGNYVICYDQDTDKIVEVQFIY